MWNDRVYLHKATFHQAFTRGSFDAWDATDRHDWGCRSESRGVVDGGFSYPHHGHRIVRHWTARPDSPSD